MQNKSTNDDTASISASENETADGVGMAADTVSEIEGGDTDNTESEVGLQVRSTKRPLPMKDANSLSSKKSKKREQEAEQQLLKSSIECMNRASESLISSKTNVGSAGDDITAFGYYIEQEMRKMRTDGMERGISVAKLRIQQIMFDVQNEPSTAIPPLQQGQYQRSLYSAPQAQRYQQPTQMQQPFWPSPHPTANMRPYASEHGHSQSPQAHSSQEGRWYHDLSSYNVQ